MNPKSPVKPARGGILLGILIFGGLFAVSLDIFPVVGSATALYLPSKSWAATVSHILFFWPQLTLLPGGLSMAVGAADSHTIGYGAMLPWTLTFWCGVGVAFGWLTRRRGVAVKIALVYPVAMSVAVGVFVLLQLFGIGPVLDGP